MTSYTGKLFIVAGLALILTVTGCEQSNDGLSDTPKYATSIPAVLRNIPIPDLSVRVTIDNVTKTYNGSDFPDGQWRIEYDLQPNQTYDLLVQWFVLTHLVLEETGQITTDTEQRVITPELDFTSAGYPRFDDDCDGQSNLDEIRNGNSLTTAPGTDQSACSDDPEVVEIADDVYPWIIRQHKVFASADITSRVTSYKQSINITLTDVNVAANFGLSLNSKTESGDALAARVDFIDDNLNGKKLRFYINHATDFQPITEPGVECRIYDNSFGTPAVTCTVPYDWKEQQWYSISIEQLSTTSWQATVQDETSGLSQIIGIIETQPDIDWNRPQSTLGYRTRIPSEDCSLGVAPISMRFKHGVANQIHTIDTQQIVLGSCVKVGAGWSEGIRTIDNELIYRLTLGRTE